jgi:hypothetical protein
MQLREDCKAAKVRLQGKSEVVQVDSGASQVANFAHYDVRLRQVTRQGWRMVEGIHSSE